MAHHPLHLLGQPHYHHGRRRIMSRAVAILTATDLIGASIASNHHLPPWPSTQRRLRRRYLHRDRLHWRRRRVLSCHRPHHTTGLAVAAFTATVLTGAAALSLPPSYRTATASPPPFSSAIILIGAAASPTRVFTAIALPRSVISTVFIHRVSMSQRSQSRRCTQDV